VYGLFGYFYALRKERQEFAEIAHPGNVQMMVGWFFVCIVLTWMEWMPVGNVAHGMGAVGGLALGWIVKAGGSRRRMGIAGLGFATAAIVLMASVFRPYVNVAAAASFDHVWLGFEALVAKNDAKAEEHFIEALKVNPSDGQALYYLALLRNQQERYPEAAELFVQAWKKGAPFPDTKERAFEMANFVAEHAAWKEAWAEADKYYQMALSVEPDNKGALHRYGGVLLKLGRTAEAEKELERAKK
jgi:tetratricopeptide (TPR) repeat protein